MYVPKWFPKMVIAYISSQHFVKDDNAPRNNILKNRKERYESAILEYEKTI